MTRDTFLRKFLKFIEDSAKDKIATNRRSTPTGDWKLFILDNVNLPRNGTNHQICQNLRDSKHTRTMGHPVQKYFSIVLRWICVAGITTVLTLLTIITGSNNNMPKISYMKAIDVYFAGCFFFVFCSLVEFTAVCYLDVAGEMDLMQSGDTAGTSSPDGNNRDEDQLNDSSIRIAQKEKYFLHDKPKVNYSHRKVSTNCFSYSNSHCTQ